MSASDSTQAKAEKLLMDFAKAEQAMEWNS
jgi:hypothetical protein